MRLFLKPDEISYVLFRYDVDGTIIFVGEFSVHQQTTHWTANINQAKVYQLSDKAKEESEYFNAQVGNIVLL